MTHRCRTGAFWAAFLALSTLASAQTQLAMTIDTSGLVGHAAAPFYLAFALTDGDGGEAAHNVVTVGEVDFGGGSPLGGPQTFGGASGSLETSVVLTDSDFLNELIARFAPGDSLRFSVSFSGSTNNDGPPDRLSVQILDGAGVPVPTLAPAGDYFIGIDLLSPLPNIDLWASDPARATSAGVPVSVPAATYPSRAASIRVGSGKDPAPVDPARRGSTVVAVLSSSGFDLFRTITRDSLRFGRTGYEAAATRCNRRDVDRDGVPDLACRFRNRDMGFNAGDQVGILRGRTTDGALLEGRTSVTIINTCRDGVRSGDDRDDDADDEDDDVEKKHDSSQAAAASLSGSGLPPCK